jgi:hypothetical protein
MATDRPVRLQGSERRFDSHAKKPCVLYVWYSICSKHRDYKPGCAMCDSGRWGFEPSYKLSGLFYRLAPSLWIRWANRG